MQLWNTHNPFRALMVCTDGYMVLWEYRNSTFLSEFNPLVRERRTGADFFYFGRSDRAKETAIEWSREVLDLIREHCGGNTRIGIDKIMMHGSKALEAIGLEIMEGEELTEKARSIKGPDEIKAMRCAGHACELSVRTMEDYAREFGPKGTVSENDIWAVLHAENIRRGGEWIETRLLASGPRTNPWFKECGPRKLCNNEILGFDTDLIGAYEICIDFSRTWWIGDRKPTDEMIYAMRHVHEHIMTNIELLRPGITIPEISRRAHRLADRFQKLKYGCMMHGVGLCDEWPHVSYPDHVVEGAFDHELKPGMVLCVEALVGEDGGDFSIKLEDQVLITEDGHENLTTYPFDTALMGQNRS